MKKPTITIIPLLLSLAQLLFQVALVSFCPMLVQISIIESIINVGISTIYLLRQLCLKSFICLRCMVML